MVQDLEQRLAEHVPAAVSGDPAAIQRVITLIYPLVLRYVRTRISMTKHPTPDDVAQEVCLAVSTAIHTYVDRGRPFMAFVYGIAFNKVADARRSMGRDRLNPTDDVPDDRDNSVTPEESVLIADEGNRVRALLDSLSDRAREVIVLRVFVGLSAEETADVIGTTPGAVRVAQHRALATLRKTIEG